LDIPICFLFEKHFLPYQLLTFEFVMDTWQKATAAIKLLETDDAALEI